MMAGSDDGRIGFDQVQGGLHVWCGRQSVFDQLPQVVLTDPDRLQKRLGVTTGRNRVRCSNCSPSSWTTSWRLAAANTIKDGFFTCGVWQPGTARDTNTERLLNSQSPGVRVQLPLLAAHCSDFSPQIEYLAFTSIWGHAPPLNETQTVSKTGQLH